MTPLIAVDGIGEALLFISVAHDIQAMTEGQYTRREPTHTCPGPRTRSRDAVVEGGVATVVGGTVVPTDATVVLGAERATTVAVGVRVVGSGMASEVWVLVTSFDAPPHALSTRSRSTSSGLPYRPPTLIAASSSPYRDKLSACPSSHRECPLSTVKAWTTPRPVR